MLDSLRSVEGFFFVVVLLGILICLILARLTELVAMFAKSLAAFGNEVQNLRSVWIDFKQGLKKTKRAKRSPRKVNALPPTMAPTSSKVIQRGSPTSKCEGPTLKGRRHILIPDSKARRLPKAGTAGDQ